MEKKKFQFFRTIAGKALLFLTINLALLITFLCVCASAVCFEEDLYGRTESEFYLEKSEANIYYNTMSNARLLINKERLQADLISFEIRDESGKTIAATNDFNDAKTYSGKAGKYLNYILHNYDVVVAFDSEGHCIGVSDDFYRDDCEIIHATIEAYADPDDFVQYTEFDKEVIHLVMNLRYAVYPIAVLCFIIGIAAFIALMCVAGKRPGTEETALGPLGKVPFDILAILTLSMTMPLFMFLEAANGFFAVFIFAVAFFTFINAMLGLCVSLSARVKLHMLIKESFIYRFTRLIIKGILAVPLVWRTVLILGALSFTEIIFIVAAHGDTEGFVIGWFLEKLFLYPFIFYIALMLRKLRISGEKMAKGDISYRTSTKGLWGDFKKHAVNLNSVADSVTIAVEDRLKSERMKTELITNVSHDIKTPLTSIINYASLMGTTDPSDPKMSEYSEVVVRQSEKLKRLIEDLVEASKASTGNLEIVPAPLDCCTFISQTAGEFKEKLDGAGLTLVANAPEEPVIIMADGRRMMRIYDNLMNNICKYAQPGTRVYLTLEVTGGKAVTTFKNTSSAELNISAEELVERFVRGDESRNTEGNGLGLSIAKSMTELQGGSFEIAIDGDLFKVSLSFPVVTEQT